MDKLPMDRQLRILRDCVRRNLDLDAVLLDMGLTYDCLGYRHNVPVASSIAILEDVRSLHCPSNGVPVVSFFSGAGGLDLGFEAAGYEHVAAFEYNSVFCETLRKNRPGWSVFEADLSCRDIVHDLLRQCIGRAKRFPGVFHGGPPCRPFSVAANQRFSKASGDFKRIGFAKEKEGTLLLDFVWYIKEFQPLAFLIENVLGLIDVDGGTQLRSMIDDLEGAGYKVSEPAVVNASQYGVPQDRRRLIIIGTRNHCVPSLPMSQSIGVPCGKAFELPIDGVPNHVTRSHRAESILRYMTLDYGERDRLGRVDRLDPKVPSKTVIAGGSGGGGRTHLHPHVPRTLSAREAARLQTFPDDYVFCGPPARQINQVGNAVPPLLAFRLASHMYETLFQGAGHRKARRRVSVTV